MVWINMNKKYRYENTHVPPYYIEKEWLKMTFIRVATDESIEQWKYANIPYEWQILTNVIVPFMLGVYYYYCFLQMRNWNKDRWPLSNSYSCTVTVPNLTVLFPRSSFKLLSSDVLHSGKEHVEKWMGTFTKSQRTTKKWTWWAGGPTARSHQKWAEQ